MLPTAHYDRQRFLSSAGGVLLDAFGPIAYVQGSKLALLSEMPESELVAFPVVFGLEVDIVLPEFVLNGLVIEHALDCLKEQVEYVDLEHDVIG